MKSGASATTLFREAFLYGLSKIIPGVSGLIAVVLFIRLLGAEAFGEYSFLLAQCNLTAALCYGWLNHALLRYHSKDRKAPGFQPAVLGAFSLASLVVVAVSLLIIIVSPVQPVVLGIILLCIWSMACFNLIKTHFQARIQPQRVILLTAVQAGLALLIPVVLIKIFSRTGTSLLIGVTFSFLAVSGWVIFHNIRRWVLTVHSMLSTLKLEGLLTKWLRFGFPISVWFAAGLALPFLDRFFIDRYLSPLELGAYAGLQELLTRFFSLALFPLTMALHPRIMSLWNNAKHAQAISLLKVGLISQLGIFALVIIPALTFEGMLFMGIQFAVPEISARFRPLLIPLLITGFLWQVSFLTHKMLELKERTLLMVVFMAFSLGINVIGNTIFLPSFGVIATAYTAMLSALSYFTLTAGFSTYTLIRKKY
ncbi:MAG: oligosaccharide flippase family protein [Candidatus Marinimicrobia bacterium]|nr:oligosaccharide flippase family protein [Candidatus Neomarinimicrobiota bacterium]MDP6615163.1 oligosaccharide flippase family protein [Candidatus Neomarinimicrobiota bacterium]